MSLAEAPGEVTAHHEGMRINDVSHILYRVYDRDAATKFFVDAFGCELLERGPITYAVIGNVLIEMISNDAAVEAEALSDRYMFGVSVDSLEQAIRECQEHGSQLTKPIFTPVSFWGRQAVVSVPGGMPVALREWRAPDGPHFRGWHPE
jgi:predicted enzyme related to lactoylglutathione lyase